jgi:hypothetical protein
VVTDATEEKAGSMVNDWIEMIANYVYIQCFHIQGDSDSDRDREAGICSVDE